MTKRIERVEAAMDADGRARLLGEVRVAKPRRAIVAVLEELAVVPSEAAPAAGEVVPSSTPS